MATWIRCTDAAGHTLHINLDRARVMQALSGYELGEKPSTMVHFDDDHSVVVKAMPEELIIQSRDRR